MWITKDSQRVLINDATYPYWSSLGWEPDANSDGIGDVTAAAQVAPGSGTPSPLASTAASGTATAAARGDHVHTGQKLAAIAAPSGGLTNDVEARAAINGIRAVLQAHGLTL